MFTVLEFDESVIRQFQDGRTVVVEPSTRFPGNLTFQALDQRSFNQTYTDYLSRFTLLSELFMLGAFLERLEDDGWTVVFLPDTQPILDEYARYSVPLEIDGLDLPSGLYPFQQYALNRALERAEIGDDYGHGFFFNFSPGSGKGTVAAGGAQELIVNRQQADLVIFFTLRKMKINMSRRMEGLTQLTSTVVEGSPALRRKRYLAGTAQSFVMNYEKAHFDLKVLKELVAGQRVIFILDEVQKILFGENGSPTLARKGLEELIKSTRRSIVWPMSGSIVKASPLRYHDLYRVQGKASKSPLGTKKDFLAQYASSVKHVAKFGNNVEDIVTWDVSALAEVPHRVAKHTQAVRKTDPGVREFFQGMKTEVIPVQMSSEDRALYKKIMSDAQDAPQAKYGQYYQLLRYVCNTPAALTRTDAVLAERYVTDEKFKDTVTGQFSSKMEVACDLIQEISDSGDKVVVFCSLTNMGLFLISEELERRGLNHVLHYGTGMSDAEGQKAQDDFMEDESITAFLSSDAGAYGLNLQCARYVINYDVPYDPDLLTQRNDRIDRADSYLTGLTSYLLVTDDSLEERIWATNEQRRRVTSATQGTIETLSRLDSEEYREMSESDAAGWLMFGSHDSLLAR